MRRPVKTYINLGLLSATVVILLTATPALAQQRAVIMDRSSVKFDSKVAVLQSTVEAAVNDIGDRVSEISTCRASSELYDGNSCVSVALQGELDIIADKADDNIVKIADNTIRITSLDEAYEDLDDMVDLYLAQNVAEATSLTLMNNKYDEILASLFFESTSVIGNNSSCQDYSYATCPTGWEVAGGGYEVTGLCGCGATAEKEAYVKESSPSGTNSWRVKGNCMKLKAHATCYKLGR